MLTEYLGRAMHHARYELMENGRYFATIPQCDGLWAEGPTIEVCRAELQSTLEGWLLLGFQFGDHLPVIDGIDLNRRESAAYAEAD